MSHQRVVLTYVLLVWNTRGVGVPSQAVFGLVVLLRFFGSQILVRVDRGGGPSGGPKRSRLAVVTPRRRDNTPNGVGEGSHRPHT